MAGTPTPAPAQPKAPSATNPYIGVLGVFLGASVATMNTRLLSVGLADYRGATGLGFDEATWISTTVNMAMMFSGIFCVFFNAIVGARRILLPAAAIFTITAILLPFSPSLWVTLGLEVIAGLASGTFYSLTLTFALTALPKRLVIFAIAAYAADIIFTSNIATALHGWYVEHLSWRWIFWNSAVITPLMMICVYYGIPRRPPTNPRPDFHGFTYFALGVSLLYGVLDQGERLDWLGSGFIVAMLAAGVFLVLAAWAVRWLRPNPLVNLPFLSARNVIILAGSIFVFRFVHLAPIVLIPGFLGNISHYRALQTGSVLAWVAIPMLIIVWLVAVIVVNTNSRLILAIGLTLVAAGCWLLAGVDSSWSGTNFKAVELLLAAGLSFGFIGMVGSIVLVALESGALSSAANASTFAAFMHFIRLFGGQIGVSILTRFIIVREEFHSNLLGLNVQAGHWLTDDRLRALTAGLLPASASSEEAQARAVGLLSQQVHAQAYTLAVSDGFVLMGWVVAGFLLVMLFLRRGKITYKDLRKM